MIDFKNLHKKFGKLVVLNGLDLNIKEDFAFLFVGHWLKGDLGQDRKDIGMAIEIPLQNMTIMNS